MRSDQPGTHRPPRIEVTVGSVELSPGQRIPVHDRVFSSYIRIDVKDNGIGMDAATRDRIFEPFFTTKSSSQGTGLGLAMSYAVARDHDGWLACESEPDLGTTFSPYIRVSDGDEEFEDESGTEAFDLAPKNWTIVNESSPAYS